MRIDAHLHFWRPDCGFDNKPVADHEAYRRNFLPGDIAGELDRNRIDGVVLVQTAPQVEETQWMLELARSEPRVLGVTGWVDLEREDHDFEALARVPRMVGLRAQLRRIADDAFVARPAVERNLGAALRAGLALTILAEQRHDTHVGAVLERLPPGPVTINHLGMPFPGVDRARWRASLRTFAQRPDVYLQFSGLPFLFGERWRDAEATSVLDDALDAFGPQRLLFASDWPMLLRFATYSDWVEAVDQYLRARGLDDAQVEAVFAGNVLRAIPRLARPSPAPPAARALA